MPTFAQITQYKTTAIRDAIQHLERTREDCRADGYDWTPSLGQVIEVLEAYCKAGGGKPEPDDDDDQEDEYIEDRF